jgi:hypothetical protein
MDTQQKPPYEQAIESLLEAIPGLLDMEISKGFEKIDAYMHTNPSIIALSFNPWQWFDIAKHCQKYPISKT